MSSESFLYNPIETFGGIYQQTLSPNFKHLLTTLSDGNLTATNYTSNLYRSVRSVFPLFSGKHQFEVTVTDRKSQVVHIGVCGVLARMNLQSFCFYNYSDGYAYISNGNKTNFFSDTGAVYGATYTNGDIIGVCLNFFTNELTFYKNGASQGVAFSVMSGIKSGYFAALTLFGASAVVTFNFGASAFSYPIAGYTPWNTP